MLIYKYTIVQCLFITIVNYDKNGFRININLD